MAIEPLRKNFVNTIKQYENLQTSRNSEYMHEKWCENTYLVAKFIITTLKLGIGDPDRKTLALGKHPTVDILPQVVSKAVCTCT